MAEDAIGGNERHSLNLGCRGRKYKGLAGIEGYLDGIAFGERHMLGHPAVQMTGSASTDIHAEVKERASPEQARGCDFGVGAVRLDT